MASEAAGPVRKTVPPAAGGARGNEAASAAPLRPAARGGGGGADPGRGHGAVSGGDRGTDGPLRRRHPPAGLAGEPEHHPAQGLPHGGVCGDADGEGPDHGLRLSGVRRGPETVGGRQEYGGQPDGGRRGRHGLGYGALAAQSAGHPDLRGGGGGAGLAHPAGFGGHDRRRHGAGRGDPTV